MIFRVSSYALESLAMPCARGSSYALESLAMPCARGSSHALESLAMPCARGSSQAHQNKKQIGDKWVGIRREAWFQELSRAC